MRTRMEVPFYLHNINKGDIKRVKEVLEQPFLTTGGIVEEFEKELAKFLKIPFVVGVSSCTAALHLSLLNCRPDKHTEVVVPALTFVSTASVIDFVGAKLRFVDVCPDTGLINYGLIWKDTKKPEIVIPVHLYGESCYSERFDRSQNWIIIEDAAHALETEEVGRFGHSSCFSFYPVKSITCGEGGAIACWDEKEANWYKENRLFGLSKDAYKRYEKKYQHWDMISLGYKYNMTNIQAALLIGQLKRVRSFLRRRREIDQIYRDQLTGIVQLIKGTSKGSKLMFPIFVKERKNRDRVMWALQERGVGIGIHFNPVHLMTYYRKKYGYKPGDFPVAEDLGSREISLPIYPKMTDDQIQYVIDCVKEVCK